MQRKAEHWMATSTTKTLCACMSALVIGAVASCSAPSSTITLSLAANETTAPADGVSTVQLTATIEGAPNAVVSFEVAGPALLAQTTAAAVNGTATVSLYSPLEEQLATEGATTSSATANVNVNGVLVSSEPVVVNYTLPAGGAPTLLAYASPDRVLAGGPDPIRIIVDGRRLTKSTIALSADGGLDGLPTSLEMTEVGAGLWHGELVIPAVGMNPGTVTVTLRSDETAPVDVALHFIEEGEAAFDMSGTYAEVSYGIVEIGDLIFLNPDPQCVIAPTFSLVTVQQTANEDGSTRLTFESTTCDVKMGDVNVHFLGRSTTRVEQGFIDATNANGPGPLSFDVTAELGEEFSLPASAIAEPFILGADMSDNPDAALPADENDPRVEDQDGDGNPGVTLINSTQGEQHVVYRTRLNAMRVTIQSSNAIDTEAEANTETKIFGGESPLSPTITPIPSPGFMRRVDGANGSVNIASRDGDSSSISCEDIKNYASELQVDVPPPNPATACN